MSIVEMNEIKNAIAGVEDKVEYNGGGINTLLEDVAQLQDDATAIKAKGVVKSVQRGVYNANVDTGSGVIIANISQVDTSKSVLICNIESWDSYDGDRKQLAVTLQPDKIVMDVYTGSADRDMVCISWQVIEFY